MLESSLDRIQNDILALARFNDTPDCGCTRFSYGAEDQKARAYITERFLDLNLYVTVDAVGNIRARREGSDVSACPVLTGSHLDTVYHGGMFDGAAGVVCAMEAMRVLCDNQVVTRHPVEIVVFVEEEGSNFGSTMAGSKSLIGRYSLQELKNLKNDQGFSMYDCAKTSGFDPDSLSRFVLKPGDIKAMIELHIEQSVVLEQKQTSIGIVEAIFGSRCLQVTFTGVSNHAGATPMNLRQDPMVAAAGVIARIPEIVRQKASATTVATVGKIQCQPNMINCIPDRVAFTVDIRDLDAHGIDSIVRDVSSLVQELALHNHVAYSIETIAASEAITLSRTVIDTIEEMARDMGVNYMKMNSGAVHDSAMLASLTDVGMIFVPSVGGRSHVPEESTQFEDLKQGCDLLIKTIMALAV